MEDAGASPPPDLEMGLAPKSEAQAIAPPTASEPQKTASEPKQTASESKQTSSKPAPDKPVPPEGEYNYPARQLPRHAMSKSCPAPPCYKKQIGRFYVYLEGRDGRPLCIVGPCWPMYFVTFMLIAAPLGAVLGGLARDVIWICVIGSVLGLITLTALTMTACRDPGIVRRRQHQVTEGEIYDDRGMTYRPRGAMFEHETGTVIQNIDHFCPWTSTVIAKSNMFCFLVFTRTLCVLLLFTIGVTIWGVLQLDLSPKN